MVNRRETGQPTPGNFHFTAGELGDMRLGEARTILGLTSANTPEDARKAYRRLALTAHPDKNNSPDATAAFQRIQDAFTRIQAAEESGRGGGSDDEEEEDYDEDDDYDYDDDYAFEEAAFMFMFAFGGGPPPGFGGQFGAGPPRGFGGFAHPGSEQCDCRDCRAERNAFERQEESRQVCHTHHSPEVWRLSVVAPRSPPPRAPRLSGPARMSAHPRARPCVPASLSRRVESLRGARPLESVPGPRRSTRQRRSSILRASVRARLGKRPRGRAAPRPPRRGQRWRRRSSCGSEATRPFPRASTRELCRSTAPRSRRCLRSATERSSPTDPQPMSSSSGARG